MKPDEDLIPGLRRLGEQLHDAADREIHASRRRHRAPRRVFAIALIGVLVLGAGAGAAALMGTGPLVNDPRGLPRELKPTVAGSTPPAVTVRDPAALGRWGVRVYTSRSGNACAVAGWVRGSRVGLIEENLFRPYAPDVTGACGDLSNSRFFLSLITVTQPALRTLVYGRAQPSVDSIEITGVRSARFAQTGGDGAFLFVLTGRRTLAELQPRARIRPAPPAAGPG